MNFFGSGEIDFGLKITGVFYHSQIIFTGRALSENISNLTAAMACPISCNIPQTSRVRR